MEKEKNKLMNFDAIKEFNKKICESALLLGIFVSLLFLAVGKPAIARGFLLGTCFSIINFILLGSFLPLSLKKKRRQATGICSISIFIRYFVLAIPLIVSIKSNKFEFISTVAGIFSIQIIFFVLYILKPVAEKKLFMSGE